MAISLPAVLAALVATAAVAVVPTDRMGLPLWVPRVWNDFPVHVDLADQAALVDLLARVPVASFDREQVRLAGDAAGAPRLVWEPRVTAAEAAGLAAAGVRVERLRDVEREGREAMEAAWAVQAAQGGDALKVGEKAVYHTADQAGQILQQIATDHPALARYYSLGNSVQGRPLHALVVSRNVGVREAEPAVRLAATIHGNEPLGLENLLRLADDLTTTYGTDTLVTDVVDHTEIHIIPCLNPDGLTAGIRANSHGIDLNRNYPVPDGSQGQDLTWGEEPETIAVKAHATARRFTISLVGHTGDLSCNYPWDYTTANTGENTLVRLLALQYSQYNPPMYASPVYPQGIVQGAAVYIAKGSLQDWAYQEKGCIDLTPELSTSYAPSAYNLDQLWADSRGSLLHFIAAARYGVHGVVRASVTGLPLPATVSVTGISKTVTADSVTGAYAKLVSSGTWALTFAAPGYVSRTVTGVTTTWGTGVTLDVTLDAQYSGGVTGTVTNAALEGLAAAVTVRTWPLDLPVTTTTANPAADGAYALDLPYGDYVLRVGIDGYATQERHVTVASASRTESFTLTPAPDYDIYADDFELGLAAWTGGWATSIAQSVSPTHAVTDSPAGNYANGADNALTLAAGLNLAAAIEGTVSFQARWSLQLDNDGVFFEVSTNGGLVWTPVATAWTTLASGQGGQLPVDAPVFEGTQGSWMVNTVDLAPWVGLPDVRFRFRLRSDAAVTDDGFWVDDFLVRVKKPYVTGAGDAPSSPPRLAAAPNPFNPATVLRFSLARAGHASLVLHDLQGRRVRTLVDGVLPAGPHAVRWDGRDARGARAASGAYFARLVTDGTTTVAPLALVK